MILLSLPLLLFWAIMGATLLITGLASFLLAYGSLPQVTFEGISYNAISLCVFQNWVPRWTQDLDYIVLALRVLPFVLLGLALVAFVLVGNLARLLPRRSDRYDTLQAVLVLNIIAMLFILLGSWIIPVQLENWLTPPENRTIVSHQVDACHEYLVPADSGIIPTAADVQTLHTTILQTSQSIQFVLMIASLALLFFIVLLWRYQPDNRQLHQFFPVPDDHCQYCGLDPRNRQAGVLGCALCHADIRVSVSAANIGTAITFELQQRTNLSIQQPVIRFDSAKNFTVTSIESADGNTWRKYDDRDASIWTCEAAINHDTLTLSLGRNSERGQVRVAVRPETSQIWSQWHVIRDA